MALTSPGVQVSVIDESFYTPAEPGTTPIIFVATAQNKLNGAGTGIAPGTTKANAGKVIVINKTKMPFHFKFEKQLFLDNRFGNFFILN